MILCYVTYRRLLSGASLLDELLQRVECTAAAGIDWIQIREKDLSARELVDFTRRALVAVRRTAQNSNIKATRVIVNDRADVALAAGAAGVHLSAASTPVAETVHWLRRNAPAGFSAGVSCHSVSEAVAAEMAGASYVFFGPVYETPSKMDFGKPQGLEALAEVCRSVCIPVVAIGGLTEANAPACVHAGASGIAAIRLFQQHSDPAVVAGAISRLRALG